MKSTSRFGNLRQRFLNRYTLLALALALVLGTAYWGWHKYYGKKDPSELFQVTEVERGDIEDLVTATGTVQPLEYVDVGAQVSGQLKKLHIEVGSVVKEGDLLAEIDPTVFRATVDARRAGLRNQQATMKERESNLALANLQFTRQKNLMAADATTAEALQTAEATLRAAKAQIDALQAQIEQTQSTLRADEANLNYAKIYAPMAGTVVSLTARQGQTLNANQNAPTILRIADLSTMTVQTQVSEAEVGKLRKNMEVYFTTLGSQGKRWYGTLRKVEPTPTVTNNVVLYNALFDVPNSNQALLPSMTTQVFFIAATAKDVLVVPTAAVTLARTSGNAAGSNAKTSDKSSSNAFAGMSQAERRAAFEKMTPEQREAMRERRRAQKAEETNKPATDAAKAVAQPQTADNKTTSNKASADKQSADQATSKIDALTADSNIGSPPVAGKDSSGLPGEKEQRASRRGTVRMIGADGKVETRDVELGVTNRVQMQVLSGLKEGDRVITGLKQTQANANRPSGVAGMPPGMGGSPMRGGR